ncbi:MAG: substrate-binding domain-containing protein [Firmicutes bacterium]|nr:substrate-binding domain-containing protein [Bacillota bacterium]
MKKLLVILLALSMVFAFSACGQEEVIENPEVEVETPEVEGEAEGEEEQEEVAKSGIDLTILYEQDDSMINNYSLLAVNPDAPFVDADGNAVADVALNTEGASALINWMLSEEAAELTANFGFEEYGEYLFYLKEDRPVSAVEIPAATEETKAIRLSTTTSVNDSGLLGYLLPFFEEEYGYTVEVFSAGTGKSIANAKAGNADLILVHSKSQEEAFVADGYSYVLEGFEAERLTYMYNYFVLVGPSADPAAVASAATVKDAFAAIADGEFAFVSRGDNSGTHTKEISLWPEDLGITAEMESVADYTGWYTFSNAGMGVCLTMAEEMGAYILTDKATYLTFRANDGVIE